MSELQNRRPLRSRDAGWARAFASFLGRAGVSPDGISAMSVLAALIGASCLVASGPAEGPVRAALLAAALICVQLRLVCNLLDGMVAVEHGRGGPTGPIWNELPDRIADPLFLVAAGYGAAGAGVVWGAPVGWLAGLLAVLTAYVRELGRALGCPADFSGPMAKPHRMAVLTAACVISIAEPLWRWRGQSLAIALAIITLGSALTVVLRTLRLARRLRERAA